MGEQEIGTISERLQDTVSVIICKFVCSLHSMAVLSSQAHGAAKPRYSRAKHVRTSGEATRKIKTACPAAAALFSQPIRNKVLTA